ncbi:SAV_915 family protein [Amycolatopsis anabasis]|uniref:SAV_915 family protein n=1 Tax=Amycolatopsis anabasis TaxID=1840409 RepID=UPI00131A9BED|nr:SAV_915 family protein [Amycolatopsis anabasis]
MPPEFSDDREIAVTRSVLGSEMIEDDDAPTVLYLPTAAPVTGDEVAFVLRDLDDGSRALLVYSSLERLVEGCGDEQPWLSIRAETLSEFQYLAEADVVLWDPVLAPAIRQYGNYDTEDL